MPGPCQLRLIKSVEVKKSVFTGYMCLLLFTQNCMFAGGPFIACISLLSKTKTIPFDEEQSRSLLASSSHGRWSNSRRTSDPEELELIAKKKKLLVPNYR